MTQDQSPNLFASATSGEEVIGQAVGAASMCWDNPEFAGVFHSERARQIADDAIARLRKLSGKAAALADAEVLRENRTLRWKLKTMGRQLGKQGQAIHDLRNTVDALRHTEGLRSIGDYRRLLQEKQALDRENRMLKGQVSAQADEIAGLRAMLPDSRPLCSAPPPFDDELADAVFPATSTSFAPPDFIQNDR